MKVKSESEVAQSCPTLRDLIDCSLPGSSVYGIFQARVLEWGAIAFSKSIDSWYHYFWNDLFTDHRIYERTSLVAQMVKCLSTMRETWVRSLGQEDPLDKDMAIHSSTIAWKIPYTEEPGRLQSVGLQRIGPD